MKRYLIQDVKCDVLSGGPEGIVCTAVKYSDGRATKWITNVEVEGIPNFYLTKEDIFDKIMADDDDEEFQEYRDEHFIEEFNGVELGEYVDIVNSLMENEKKPAAALIKYVIAITRCEMEDMQEMIAAGKGKYADEIEITIDDMDLDLEDDDF